MLENMFETKSQRTARLQEHSPEYIKYKAISNMPLFPEKGETWDFRGGIGNKILKQIKNEDGIIYERNSPQDNWVIMDTTKVFERMLSFIRGISGNKTKRKKWYQFWK